MNEKIKEMFEKTVEQFISEDRAFTGYDITLATRSRECIQIRHRDVNSEIHSLQAIEDEVESGFYDCTNVTNPEGGVVILYHPVGYDVKEYKFLQDRTETAALPAPVPTLPQLPKVDLAADLAATAIPLPSVDFGSITPIVAATPVSTGSQYTLDMRGRLLLPFVRIMTLGMKTGSDVHVLPKPEEKKLLVSSTSFNSPLENKITLEREGIFISAKLLRIAGLEQSDFKVESVKNGDEKLLEIS